MYANVKYVLIALTLMFLPTLSLATITFDATGKWETTFDCDPVEGGATANPPLNCDGMTWGVHTHAEGQLSSITQAANHPQGSGGLGFRHWKSSGAEFRQSTSARIPFATPQREIWIRWYSRWEEGVELPLGYAGEKQLYFFYPTHNAQYMGFYGSNGWRITRVDKYEGVSAPQQIIAPYGWSSLFEGTNRVSDGRWTQYEVHLKIDTDGTDGIARLWINGDLKMSRSDLNYGLAPDNPGWSRIHLLENQADPQMGRNIYVDVDDVVVYNQTPPNIDDFGNAFIGPIGLTQGKTNDLDTTGLTGPTNPVTGLIKEELLFVESFEDNLWSNRGWYDGTSSSGVKAGGHLGNALHWTWSTGNTQPTGFSTIRRVLDAAVDEFLIEYYVKYDAGWQGATPHLIHLVSTEDWAETGYGPLASNHSNLYFESSTVGGLTYPVVSHQDSLRAVSSTNDLTGRTEIRSANHCDTPYSLSGATGYACFASGGGWYSQNVWRASSVHIPIDEWVKITTYIRKNSYSSGIGNFDGIMRVWVNDVLAIEGDTVLYAAGEYSDTAWNKIALAPYIGKGSSITQSMWIDELKIWSVSGSSRSSEILPSPLLRML